MNKIKLIATDIDGTIMNSDFKISQRVKETINQAVANNIYVVLVTGRMFQATLHIAKSLDIKTPLVTYQGSFIKEFYGSDNILLNQSIPKNSSFEIIKELRNFDVQINYYFEDKLLVERETDIMREYATTRKIPYENIFNFENIIEKEPTKIVVMDNDVKKIDKIRNYLIKKYSYKVNVFKSTSRYCEIVNKNASKGNAILYLASEWGIKQSEIMVMGDQENDIEMLKVANIAVAMGNATDKVKDIATYVTDSVDNDGAAKAIEKFVLGGLNV